MSIKHPSILRQALRLPAAILIRTDIRQFRDPTEVGYEIGIEQPSRSQRFANLFISNQNPMLYFKHDPAQIERLRAIHPGVIQASEIAPAHWSKMWVKQQPALASELLNQSYQLVLDACSAKGQRLVADPACKKNHFLVFHDAAVALQQRADVRLTYDIFPLLVAGDRHVARFSWNQLETCTYRGRGWVEHWEPFPPSGWREWPAEITAAVRRAAKG